LQLRIKLDLWESRSIIQAFDVLLLNKEAEEAPKKNLAVEISPPLRSKPQARDPLEASAASCLAWQALITQMPATDSS